MTVQNFVYLTDKQGRSLTELEPLPPVAAVRPPRCPSCNSLAVEGGKTVLHGHGWRTRGVVVVRREDQGVRFVLTRCWARRFLCSCCHRSCVVLPHGVLPGYLYSLAAVIAARWGTTPVLNGDEAAEAVCAPVGADRAQEPVSGLQRWRSPYRWFSLLSRLWPTRVLRPGGWRSQVEALLISFTGAAKSLRPEALARAAAHTHRWGGAVV